MATDVAARGLDVPDCMHVINFELPRDINSYVHRIGRTGRMGRQGSAISLFGPTNKPVARELVTLLQEASQITPEWLLKFAAEGSNNAQGRNYNHSGGRGGKFGGRDFRQNTQVRQYRHSTASAPPAGYEQANGQRMPNAQMPGGWPQQGYLAGIQHKQPGMYGQGVPAVGVAQMPNADPNAGWVAGGWQQMGMAGMQQMPPASSGPYQQQMSPANGQRANGQWMGMQAQAQYAQYYGQQPAQGGQEQSNPAMMSMGMMWPQQQQMPVSPGQMPDGQFAPQQHYGAQPIH